MTNAERYAVLNKARRVLDEMADEARDSGHDCGATTGEARAAGVLMATCSLAEDAVFAVLNYASSYCDDPDAARAIAAWMAGTDQDPEADEARRLSEGGPRTASDGEHAADNARAISEGTL